mmetsp:Transcript_29224/g.58832  ORF Transcript_29224/g.58832 Transcript_29224/m.58832 type:complete len:215 (-) Transcript_29224:41-685(-)
MDSAEQRRVPGQTHHVAYMRALIQVVVVGSDRGDPQRAKQRVARREKPFGSNIAHHALHLVRPHGHLEDRRLVQHPKLLHVLLVEAADHAGIDQLLLHLIEQTLPRGQTGRDRDAGAKEDRNPILHGLAAEALGMPPLLGAHRREGPGTPRAVRLPQHLHHRVCTHLSRGDSIVDSEAVGSAEEHREDRREHHALIRDEVVRIHLPRAGKGQGD